MDVGDENNPPLPVPYCRGSRVPGGAHVTAFMCFLSFHSFQPPEIGSIFISLFQLGPFGHREVS